MFTDKLKNELDAIHKKHGFPEAPGGPSTEVVSPYTRATAESVGNWGGQEEEAAERFNEAIDALLSEWLDIRYVENDIYFTTWTQGSKEWQAYQEEAWEAFQSFMAHEAFGLFRDEA